MITALILILFGYFTGGIPFGMIVASLRGTDIRSQGSGNIGATNVTRVLGVAPGALVLALDAAKGALPTYLAIRYCGVPWVVVATAWAAILGHCFSPYLEFTGGKGVATSFGVFLVLAPELAIGGVIVFLFIVAATKKPALGSLAAVIVIAAIAAREQPREIAFLAVGTALLLLYTHRSNLAKLTR